MWADPEGNCNVSRERTHWATEPVHVIQASPEAHEQRVQKIARIIDPMGFRRGGGDMPYASFQYARDYAVSRARAVLASVYSAPAPAGKGRAKL